MCGAVSSIRNEIKVGKFDEFAQQVVVLLKQPEMRDVKKQQTTLTNVFFTNENFYNFYIFKKVS